MTILDRLYNSSGPEVIIETLEIKIGSDDPIYLAKSYEDVTATTESGDTVTFEASGIDIALPARNDDGTQDLQFAVSNITGAVSTRVRAAILDLSSATLTHRRYISTDLSAPADTVYSLAIKSGQWNSTEAQIIAGYANVLDAGWPRYRYTLPLFPGLRYISS